MKSGNLDHQRAFSRYGATNVFCHQSKTGPEHARLIQAESGFHTSEYERLVKQLESEMNQSRLPDTASAGSALNDLLVRLRLAKGAS